MDDCDKNTAVYEDNQQINKDMNKMENDLENDLKIIESKSANPENKEIKDPIFNHFKEE